MARIPFSAKYLGLGLALFFTACGGSPYFNTWFNLNRSFEQGERDLQARRDTSRDTSWTVPAEKESWGRVVLKGTKILRQWPTRKDYHEKAVFRMAYAHMRMGDWNDCLSRFDDYEKNFPQGDSVYAAQYWRVTCLTRKGDVPLARFALGELVQQMQHPYRQRALADLAWIESSEGRDSLSRSTLERLLAQPGDPSILRGRAHLQLAELAWKAELWPLARQHYLNPSLGFVPNQDRFHARLRAALSFAKMGQPDSAMSELDSLARDPQHKDSVFAAKFALAELRLKSKEPTLGLNLLLALAKERHHTDEAARAWYALGEYEKELGLRLDLALRHYDSAATAQPRSSWAGWARQRATGLRNILEARQNTGNDPQVALRASESFLLLLDQPDSSLALLSRVSADTAAPQAYRVKALYGSAYLWGTAKADSVRSDSLYRQVVQLYPGTEFAKQAQRNLGLEVDQMTQEDRSARYLSLADSAYSEGQYALASAWTDTTLKYQPDAEAGARALWLKAHYRAALKDTVGIKAALTTLLEKHPGSIYHPWAQAMLDGRVLPDGQALENERQSLAMLQRRFEELVQMRERDEKTKADRESQQGGEKAEEELLWDYNQMYDF